MLYIAVKDRKYRWEVGYGVESTLNAALIGSISRDYLVPNFRNGDYEKGVLQAEDVVKRLLLNSNDADIVALRNESQSSSKLSSFIFIFVIIFILMIAISIFRTVKKLPKSKKQKNSFYHGAAAGLFMGGFGRGGFGGGGSGGFGGFSGGGGGFGGGGGGGSF